MMPDNYYDDKSKITKSTEMIKQSLSSTSLNSNSDNSTTVITTNNNNNSSTSTNNSKKTPTRDDSTAAVTSKQKKKLSTTELINQINQQQVNSLMYSFVTFEGKLSILCIIKFLKFFTNENSSL